MLFRENAVIKIGGEKILRTIAGETGFLSKLSSKTPKVFGLWASIGSKPNPASLWEFPRHEVHISTVYCAVRNMNLAPCDLALRGAA